MKTYVHIKICTWIFRTALFRIALNWKQPICLWNGWIDKEIVVYAYSGILFSNKKEQTDGLKHGWFLKALS